MKVKEEGLTVTSPVSELEISITTSLVGLVSNFTLKLSVPPASVTVAVVLERVIPALSSSVMVMVCSAVPFSVALSPPVTFVISIIAVSASSSIESSTAVKVDVPVVEPAGIEIVVELKVKSSLKVAVEVDFLPIVTVVASLTASLKTAVMVEVPPFSTAVVLFILKLTVGASLVLFCYCYCYGLGIV